MMKKSILPGILSLITFVTYAQTDERNYAEPKTAITEFSVNTDNLDDLKNLDWTMIKDLFQENDAEQEVVIAFAYMNKSEIDDLKVRVDNFEMKWTGKTSELDKLEADLKKSVDVLEEFGGQN